MSDYLIWAFVLLGVATLLFILEILIPTGGVVGLLALCAAIAAVVAFFNESVTWGLLSTLGLMLMVPLAIAFALKVFPNTPFGKKLILGEDEEDEEELAKMEELRREEEQRRQALVGAHGVTTTPLRPVGSVKIDGVTIEASSEAGMLETGVEVRVTRVDGSTVKVRPV
ncbi:MAG: NfeD family protein [Phycisphaerales bacterium JB065]